MQRSSTDSLGVEVADEYSTAQIRPRSRVRAIGNRLEQTILVPFLLDRRLTGSENVVLHYEMDYLTTTRRKGEETSAHREEEVVCVDRLTF